MYSVAGNKLLLHIALIYISVAASKIFTAVGHKQQNLERRQQPEASVHLNFSLFESFSNDHAQSMPQLDNEPKSNGSAILEDLVNQFLEKNREAVQQYGTDQALDLEAHHHHKQQHRAPVERSSGEMGPEPMTAAESGGGDQFAAQVFGTGSGPQNGQAEADELAVEPAAGEQPMPQEFEDRHILYDIVPRQHQPSVHHQVVPLQQLTQQGSAGGGRHLSDYKLSSTDLNEQEVSNSSNSNSTKAMQSSSFQETSRNSKTDSSLKLNTTPEGSAGIYQQQFRHTNSSNESPVTSNSTNVVDVVAPSPLMDEQMLSNLTERSMSSVQARSMYSGNSAPNNKTPQHTRPPYATQSIQPDQFSAHNTAEAHTEPATANSAISSQHKGNVSLETQLGTSSNQIISIESAPSRTIRDQVRQLSGDSRSQMHNNDKHHINKLTNTQLVELSPIPGNGGNKAQAATEHGNSGGDRLHFSKESSLFGTPSRVPHNDRYSANSASGEQQKQQHKQQQRQQQQHYEQPANTLNDLVSSEGFYLNSKNGIEHQIELNSKNDAHDPSRVTSNYALNMDFSGSRYQQSGGTESQQHPSSGERESINTRHHQVDHLPNTGGAMLVLHKTPPPTHYAASLINVTAPMVLPLSASEAMETALGGGQAAKNLLNQVSGLLRPALDSSLTGSRAHFNVSERNPTINQQQAPQPQYYMPGFSGAETTYSSPANQFSPPTAQVNSLTGFQNDSSNSSLSSLDKERMRLDGSSYIFASNRRPTTQYHQMQQHSAMNVSQPQHQASGFRSPPSSQSHLSSASSNSASIWGSTSPPLPSSYLGGSLVAPNSGQQQAPTILSGTTVPAPQVQQNATVSQQQQQQTSRPPPQPLNLASSSSSNSSASIATATTNGFITGGTGITGTGQGSLLPPDASASLNRRVFNLTRVEHISAECSNDLIRTVIVFNGTFKGIIYSSGYVRDPECLYINGTGKTRYDFSIRLNQCGTLGREKLHPPSAGPNEVRRRDQVMWNTLSIQYNPIIEQEWDEHFRVSCEYGSDFWKTVSFSPFNVETNTGAPVVFTVDPPSCQMEIIRGHNMMGPRQEAISTPVTVGDPLTLLIHMKAEKAGYDILVKNCIAHNGGHQKMQLIDGNGCVTNERFISPFRGTYNDNDMKHVTLYSYLKAFRFTGSPVLYLECEIHMCQSSCPPQMCYWRRLSKRSVDDSDLFDNGNSTVLDPSNLDELSTTSVIYQPEVTTEATPHGVRRKGRQMLTDKLKSNIPSSTSGQISDEMKLFQAIKVFEKTDPENGQLDETNHTLADGSTYERGSNGGDSEHLASVLPLMCYRRAEVIALIFAVGSLLLVALSITIGCCWRIASIHLNGEKRLALATPYSFNSANSSPINSPSSCTRSSFDSLASSGGSSVGAYPGFNPRDNKKQQQTCNYFQSSTTHQKSLSPVGSMMLQTSHHNSKQRHKEYLISPNH